jgi:hypothetical protein
MATITLNVTNEVNEEFRRMVKTKLGEGKGKLGRAMEEAIKIWISEQKQKDISERQLKMMKNGIWSAKNFNFNRDEIYEER